MTVTTTPLSAIAQDARALGAIVPGLRIDVLDGGLMHISLEDRPGVALRVSGEDPVVVALCVTIPDAGEWMATQFSFCTPEDFGGVLVERLIDIRAGRTGE